MSQEHDPANELLKQETDGLANGTAGPQAVTAALRRERRRTIVWAVLTVLAWVLVGGYCTANVMVLLVFFHPRLTQLLAEQAEEAGGVEEFMVVLAEYLYYANIVWPILVTLAAVVTVAFVLRSRRATLRQVQRSLAEISRQIRALETASGGRAET
jgi:hypothetical protein